MQLGKKLTQSMTITYRQHRIEVGPPLVALNAESVRQRSIHHGDPSRRPLWCGGRPLAACRISPFSRLVADPDRELSYLNPEVKLKVVGTEALRGVFKETRPKQDYTAIVEMAKRLPEAVIQEDPALLIHFDNATLLKGE